MKFQRKKKKLRVMPLAFLLMVIFGLAPQAAAAAGGQDVLLNPPEDPAYQLIRGAGLSAVKTLDLWHHSGGYWQVGNKGSEKIKVTDGEMSRLGISRIAARETAEFTLELPGPVKAKLEEGKTVVPRISPGSGADLEKLFDMSSLEFEMAGNTLYFYARPIFNIVPSDKLAYSSYELDLDTHIPFVHQNFGYNMYSVFGNGVTAVQVDGWVDPDNKDSMAGMPSGRIHPSMIADLSGKLLPGYQIAIKGRLQPSAGYGVGEGTFAKAGACGLCFAFPVRFTFYEHIPEPPGGGGADPDPGDPDPPKPPDPPTPPEPEKCVCQKCGKDELTEEGVCAADTCPHFDTPQCGCFVSPDVRAAAVLNLPPRTYESHPVTAADNSLFLVDGTSWSAKRAYAEGIARNSFSIVESGAGSVGNDPEDRTLARVTFPQKGHYNVRLKVSPKWGGTVYDTKPIEVLKTPTVTAALEGAQKQNRKQVLKVKVATGPDNPLTDLYIEIRRPLTGEKVRLENRLDGVENTLQNSEIIKTRPIVREPSDAYWTNCRLEFLTKNDTAEDFVYYVYARDSRGLWDELEVSFNVEPDRPPQAAVDLAPSFLREAGTNTAIIKAEDVSLTDGDQLERTWSVAWAKGYNGVSDVFVSPAAIDPFAGSPYMPIKDKPGYRDNSFGSGKSIQFHREGAGRLQLKLLVKDVWTEETLPEYIADADYLTASAVAQTKVGNVAPAVSLEPVAARTAELLLLAGGESEYQALRNAAPDLRERLLAKGVDPEIAVERMSPAPSESAAYDLSHSVSAPYGFQGTWSGFWETGSWLVDERRLYKAEATWRREGASDTEVYPGLPFILRAYDITGGGLREAWSYTLAENAIEVPDRGYGASLSQDLDGKYLYFHVGEKTILLDKAAGARLAVLDYRFGPSNAVWENNIYSYREDGIYRVSMADGGVKKIYGGRLSAEAARRLGGEDHFMVTVGTKRYRGIFNPRTERIRLEPLAGGENDAGGGRYRLAAIDTEGRLLVSRILEGSGSGRVTLRAYSPENKLLKEAGGSVGNPNMASAVPVYDAGGRMRYMGLVDSGRGGSSYATDARLWGIDNDYSGAAQIRDQNGYPTMAGRPLAGVEHPNGSCYILTGAEWTYIANEGYNNGPGHGMPERTKAFKFDIAAGAAGVAPLGGGAFAGIGGSVEYGTRSDAYMAFSTGDNNQNQEKASHTTGIVTWGQGMDEILSRHLNRSLSGRKDLSAVLLLDSRDAGARNPGGLAERLAETQTMWLYGGGSPYAAQIAAAAGGIAMDADRLAASAAEALLKEENQGGRLLQVKTGDASGKVERDYRLAPGIRYFYEYDYQAVSGPGGGDMAVFSAAASPSLPAEDFLPDRYRVTESFSEDFSGGEASPFFSLSPDRVAEGKYRLAYGKGRSGSSRYHSDRSEITFTVPEGSRAVLSFDYDVNRSQDFDWNMAYYIDGKIWKQFVSTRQAGGHYTHPDLLEPGVHTLKAICGTYGKSYEFWCLIDNLRVDLVGMADSGGEGASPEKIAADAAVTGSGSWKRVTGSFTAPRPVGSYAAVPSGHSYSDAEALKAGRGNGWIWDSQEYGNKAIRFYPNGAVYMGLELKSRIDPDRDPVNYTLGSYAFTARKHRYNEDETHYLQEDFLVPFRSLGSQVTGTIRHRAFNSLARGDFSGLELAWTEKDYYSGPVREGRFILAPDAGGQKKVFAETDLFDGTTTLAFSPGAAGEYRLKNLKIYRVENGVRVYVEDSSLGEADTVARWRAENAEMAVVRGTEPEEPETQMVYRKGELVSYQIHYFDYEKDPSKKQCWRYTHTPFNDGPHPQAAVILDESGNVAAMPGTTLPAPIHRFYIDGKYTVEHWQEDDTTRGLHSGGNPDYDKASNVESLTFYIQGGGAAPWITFIRTDPAKVQEGKTYTIHVGVDDREKDPLRLTVEVYKEGKRIFNSQTTGLLPDKTGKYPVVKTSGLPLAQAGRYEIVCAVRDDTGVGMDSHRFTVISGGKVVGAVSHTDQWDENRKYFNVNHFGRDFNQPVTLKDYLKYDKPRPRSSNVFWSGEEFALRAEAGGNPEKVWAQIAGYPGYQTVLMPTGEKTPSGDAVYTGRIWDKSMLHKWGRDNPVELTFRFTAVYGKDVEKRHDVKVIVDDAYSYWLLHRFQ